MENILDSYKKIVHKAVDLGLLSEENKPFYLSSIDQSVTANCGGSDLHPQPHAYARPSALGHSFYHSINGLKEVPNQPISDCAPPKYTAFSSETSQDNYSILDMKSPTSDSDLDYYYQSTNRGCRLEKSRIPYLPTNLIHRKPKRNKIVDFHIPVYLDIRKRKNKMSTEKGLSVDYYKSFSLEDTSDDDPNPLSTVGHEKRSRKKNIASRKERDESENEEMMKEGVIKTTMFSFENVSEDDNPKTHDIACGKPNEDCNDLIKQSIKTINSLIEKAGGDVSSRKSRERDESAPPKGQSRVDAMRVNDRFEVTANDYCKIKEVLVLNSAEDVKTSGEAKEKLLQVNIFCQLAPNAAVGKDLLKIDSDSKTDSLSTQEVLETEKNQGSSKEKTRRKSTMHRLSKMFSRITQISQSKK